MTIPFTNSPGRSAAPAFQDYLRRHDARAARTFPPLSRRATRATWLALTCLLAAGSWWPWLDWLAVPLAAWNLCRMPLRAFPSQVRLAYLGLVLLGLTGPFHWIHAVQALGGTVMLLTDYCPLSRMLVILPWNRQERLSWALLWRLAFAPPVAGLALKLGDGRQPV
ncbi:hypothetical protein [Pseudoruegeria sp. HB172150]|uniref:hypothetical protein n=1 Tax=Pseudoruegeria sp. HB172150 TaxID=2721164 RepID=UPI001551DF71|nr:hypothetical protein [Pseudoruegeria sp. HB172150]